jgi:hypothetical protein
LIEVKPSCEKAGNTSLYVVTRNQMVASKTYALSSTWNGMGKKEKRKKARQELGMQERGKLSPFACLGKALSPPAPLKLG